MSLAFPAPRFQGMASPLLGTNSFNPRADPNPGLASPLLGKNSPVRIPMVVVFPAPPIGTRVGMARIVIRVRVRRSGVAARDTTVLVES